MAERAEEVVRAAGRDVRISHPDKLVFPRDGVRKIDLVRYFTAVADGALRGIANRPIVLKRFPQGADEPPFYQKRVPKGAPAWIETVALQFPSGRTADEVVVRDLAQLLWAVNMNCIELHPHPVRATDPDHPDELRIDLDPVPGVPWEDVRAVALLTRAILADHGLVGWPKTSGSRGIHVLVRIAPEWPFGDVRRAALAVAREAERRAPGRATSRWWKEERQGVFLDYNQNAKDRTVASAWSVRPLPGTRVSMPLRWEEVPDCDPAVWTMQAAIARFQAEGDAHDGIDDTHGRLDSLLALAADQEAVQGDAPWPPHFAKQPDEKPRVAPSKAKKGRREPKVPLVIIGQSEDEARAMAGLERWKATHPEVADLLEPRHVLVDKMRGRYT
ncbi:MAG: DNA polymerase domain-containing protein, partial [Deltaproteobacteria bacterium]|nr:DNA polymerase domain-containing protein [Deltaproteobacteria bacterium]